MQCSICICTVRQCARSHLTTVRSATLRYWGPSCLGAERRGPAQSVGLRSAIAFAALIETRSHLSRGANAAQDAASDACACGAHHGAIAPDLEAPPTPC